MSTKIEGSKVRFWSRKSDALLAVKAIGWQSKDVLPVHTRFCRGYAISVPGADLTFLSPERFAELFYSRNGANAQPTWYEPGYSLAGVPAATTH